MIKIHTSFAYGYKCEWFQKDRSVYGIFHIEGLESPVCIFLPEHFIQEDADEFKWGSIVEMLDDMFLESIRDFCGDYLEE